jgi:hypothetical protein
MWQEAGRTAKSHALGPRKRGLIFSSLESTPLGKINLAPLRSEEMLISTPAHEVSKILEGFEISSSSQRL